MIYYRLIYVMYNWNERGRKLWSTFAQVLFLIISLTLICAESCNSLLFLSLICYLSNLLSACKLVLLTWQNGLLVSWFLSLFVCLREMD